MEHPQQPTQAHTYPPPSSGPALEWEVTANGEKTTRGGAGAFVAIITDKFRSAAPSSRGRRYCGLSPKKLYILLGVAIACLLALIIGLAVGLTVGKNSKTQNLPLPSNTEPQTGDLTYYDPGLGACGITSTSSENIVSISHFVFDAAQIGSNPNTNPLCGRKIRAARLHEGSQEQRSVDLTVVDRCVGCLPTDLDTTTSVFDQLAMRDDGRVLVTWAWLL